MKKFIFLLTLLTLLIIPFNFSYAEDDPDLIKEREIGRKAMAQIEEQWPLTSDPAVISKLEMILKRLEPYMERRIDWEIRLVKTENLNAFCLPGGFIFFTTGMTDTLKTDSELAAVMAHEMIHADRKHSLRMAAESNKLTFPTLAVMVASLASGAAAPAILAQLAQVAITSSYTIELEKEADQLGLEALIKSGYSPTGMITLFEHFMSEEYKQPIRDYGIYMDHPETPQRLSSVVKILHEKKIPIERKYSLGLLRTGIKENKTSFQLTVDGVTVLTGEKKAGIKEAVLKTREALDKYLQLELAPYELHLVKGNLYIGNRFISGNYNGITNPDEVRNNLLKAINSARAKYPTSKFFK